MRLFAVGFMLLTLVGCQTLEERLAGRVGCDSKQLYLRNKVEAPAYSRYNFTCEGKNYVCKDVPFSSSCGDDTSVPAGNAAKAKSKGAKKKAKKNS